MSIETTLKQCRDLYMATVSLVRMFRFCGSSHRTMSQPHWVRWLKCSSEKTSGLGKFGSCGVHWGPIPWIFYTYVICLAMYICKSPPGTHATCCWKYRVLLQVSQIWFPKAEKEKLLPFFSTFLGESRHYTRSSPAGPVRRYKQLPASEASDRIPGGHSLPKQRGPKVVPRIKRPGFWIWEWSLKQPGHQNCHTILKVLYRNWFWNSQKGEPTDQWSVSWGSCGWA